MNTRIEYRDTLGTIITEQQKNNLTEYCKLSYDLNNNMLKSKLYYYGEDVISQGVYFMEPFENITTVITQLNSSHRWEIMSELEIINGYDVWKLNYFQNGVLSDIYDKQVLDTEGEYIASIGFDANNMPTRGVVKKFDLSNKNMIDRYGYINGKFDIGDYVLFGFNPDGSFRARSSDNHIFFKPYLTLQSFLENEHDGYVMNLMTQEMKDYYLNFHPLVPPFQL